MSFLSFLLFRPSTAHLPTAHVKSIDCCIRKQKTGLGFAGLRAQRRAREGLAEDDRSTTAGQGDHPPRPELGSSSSPESGPKPALEFAPAEALPAAAVLAPGGHLLGDPDRDRSPQ